MLHPGSHTDCSWTLKEVAGDGVWTGEKGASHLLRTQEVMRNCPMSGEEPGNGSSQSSCALILVESRVPCYGPH